MLSRRLILFIAVPLVCMLIAVGLMTEHFLAKRFERRMQAEVEMVARALKISVGHAVKAGREGAIKRALESTKRIGRVYSADVFDEQGQLVASTRTSQEDLDQARVSRLSDGADQEAGYRRVHGRKVYSHFVTLTGVDGRPSGFMQVTRLERDIDQFIADFRRTAAGALVVTIAAVLLIVSLGYYGAAGRAISALHHTILRVRDGDRGRRAPVFGPKEVALVARSFNEMLDANQAAEQQIERQREQQSELEQQLHRSERLAALGRLAGGVAHELGTPLSTIMGRASQALRSSSVDEQAERNLQIIGRETRRMESIVRELLDFGRTGQGRRRRVAVDMLVSTALKAVGDHLEENGTHVRLQAPQTSPSLSVDPARFERALTNLLKNASEATGEGDILVSWRELDGERVEIAVEDDGPGISQRNRQKVFEPFFTTRRAEGGTGLGLSIVHAIIAEHGGSIAAKDPHHLSGARLEARLPVNGADARSGDSDAETSSLVQWI